MSVLKSVRFMVLLLALARTGGGFAATEDVAALRAKAERGNGIAQYNLGLEYTEGRDGLPVDLPEAFVWLSLAAENGTAGKALETVLSKITDEQLAEGRRRLTERRSALAANPSKTTGASRPGGPVKSGSRGFSLNLPSSPEDAPARPPLVEPSRAPTPAPEPARTSVPVLAAAASPKAAGPAEAPPPRDDAAAFQLEVAALRTDKQQLNIELAQTRKDLEKSRAYFQAATVELAKLRDVIARLEQAAAAAKTNDSRLTAELAAARQAADDAKALAAPNTTEKSKQ